MGQAIVNPEELRRFAARLKQFNNEMMGQLTTMHGQLAGLSQTWRDREHDKFVEEFQQTLQVMKRFTEATNQHIPFCSARPSASRSTCSNGRRAVPGTEVAFGKRRRRESPGSLYEPRGPPIVGRPSLRMQP